jgi:tRNA (guanine-N7-)-methyltransferase
MTSVHLRRVRSFVRRPGRITTSQQRALASLWPRFGIEYAEQRLDLDAAFGRRAPRVLDIGFGDGEALVTSAAHAPGSDFLGVEVHEPGIGHLLVLLEQAQLTNVRVIRRDVVDVIAHMLPPASFDRVNIYFPDPWPKKRHHKRRLIQAPFLDALWVVMKPGALLHIATDWADYAEQITEVVSACPRMRVCTETALAERGMTARPPTKFERRGLRLGHTVRDFYYTAVAARDIAQ